MLRLIAEFWNDEQGAVVTAEVVLLATMGVGGAMVGMHSLAKSVNDELRESSRAFRKLDQSYIHYGFATKGAATAGSSYQQQPVKKSLQELRQYEQRLERELRKAQRERENRERNAPAEQKNRPRK